MFFAEDRLFFYFKNRQKILDNLRKFCYTATNRSKNMAIEGRYETITRPPQTGETLASLPLLQKYAEVLQTAEENLQNNKGAFYAELSEAREVSYCYALNSVYRELLKWQNKQPDNTEISQLRKDTADLFKQILPQEFPHIGNNYEIKPDFIEFDTKNAVTGEVLNPQPVNMPDNVKTNFQSVLQHLDEFLSKNETNQKYEDGSLQERERFEKFDKISFAALRKMQYYLTEKTENQHVYSFQSTEEKTRAHRNTLKKQIETLTHITADNAADFERNQQVVSNTLDGLGMRMVWCQEPPYEAAFVENLYYMKKELQQEQTPPEFYNTKLPVFLNLCQNMAEFNPEETQKMSALLKEFMEKPSKEKLIETIEETQRTAFELREIDQAKSMAMRAAFNGIIRNPSKKSLSSAIIDVLDVRDLIGQQNLSAEKQQRLDAYLKADYTSEEYANGLKNNKIWNICRQVPQFKELEKEMLAQMKIMSIPPQTVENLKYDDFAFLINRRKITNYRQISDKSGVKIASDKEKCLKNWAANHEKELRQTMFAFYKKKHTLALTLEGRKKHQSRQEITAAITERAQKETDKAIQNMLHGISTKDHNVHHFFPLSNIAYFERMTGKSFTKINEETVYINKEVHDLLHINENAMDEKGRLHFGKDKAYRTKYVHQDRIIKHGRDIEGYYDRAVMGIIMPKDGIVAMPDVNSFIFAPEKLTENIKLQAQTIEYRKTYDSYILNQTQQRVATELKKIPTDNSLESKAVANLQEEMEKATSVREYCNFSGKFFRLQGAIKQQIQKQVQEPTLTQQAILEVNTKYYQPLATLPHIASNKVSLFLTQAVELLQNKAKEIVMSLHPAQNIEISENQQEMNKARQMVADKNSAQKDKNTSAKIRNLQIKKKQHFSKKIRQYA